MGKEAENTIKKREAKHAAKKNVTKKAGVNSTKKAVKHTAAKNVTHSAAKPEVFHLKAVHASVSHVHAAAPIPTATHAAVSHVAHSAPKGASIKTISFWVLGALILVMS